MSHTQMDLNWQNMLAGIEAQVPFIRSAPHRMYRQVRERLAIDRAPSRVYLVGCGDSWYCGIATRLAFDSWTRVSTEATQALEFSRYGCPYAPRDALVVAISNSGRVARTVEAVMCARARGIWTVAGTSGLDSPIAREADVTLDLGYAERRFAPGTSSYMASLLLLYCIALHLAEVSGRMTAVEVGAKLDDIVAMADGMQRTLDAAAPILDALGRRVTLSDTPIFIGGGPSYGTALFSMAKVFETARVHAAGQELEEWAHEQYFVTGPGTYLFVISPPGASVDRAREQLWAANQMGGTTVAICDASDTETARLANISVPVYGGTDETLSALTYCLPSELFAFSYAVSKNLVMLGYDDPRVREVNFRQIFDSPIVVPPVRESLG